MSEIQRYAYALYESDLSGVGKCYLAVMREAPRSGEWVRYAEHQRELAALADERDRALARLAEVEKDAARYRWLRDTGSPECKPFTQSWFKSANECDAAIDAAIAAHEQLKG